MTPETLAALQGSIKKWEDIRDGVGKDRGQNNCPLCKLFFFHGNTCNGCPIKEKTGVRECKDTPFIDWDNLFVREGIENNDAIGIHDFKNSAKARNIANQEVEFLKGLLPNDS